MERREKPHLSVCLSRGSLFFTGKQRTEFSLLPALQLRLWPWGPRTHDRRRKVEATLLCSQVRKRPSTATRVQLRHFPPPPKKRKKEEGAVWETGVCVSAWAICAPISLFSWASFVGTSIARRSLSHQSLWDPNSRKLSALPSPREGKENIDNFLITPKKELNSSLAVSKKDRRVPPIKNSLSPPLQPAGFFIQIN